MISPNARSISNPRNERVEILVDFSLRLAVGENGSVYRRFCEGPKGFETEFDHYIRIQGMTLYGQTTCYKDRGTDGGEPNKTYEMRETFVEYLLVFLNALKMGSTDFDNVRSFHVIVGDPAYSYNYFHDLRDASYDLNIVVNFDQGTQDIYDELEKLLPESMLQDDAACRLLLQQSYSSSNSSLVKAAINHIQILFEEYIHDGFQSGEIGILLRKAIEYLAESRLPNMEEHILKSLSGAGIKEKYIQCANGMEVSDARIQRVVDKIFALRPFLPEAKCALQNVTHGWRAYVDALFENIPDTAGFDVALEHLWNPSSPGRREISRRLLVKVPGLISKGGTPYPQDLPITGVTEHNLYGKEFDAQTETKILDYLSNKFRDVGVLNTIQLKNALIRHGRAQIKSDFDYDLKNGTVVKPTQYYLEDTLAQNSYALVTPKIALGHTIKGFHSDLLAGKVKSFNSLRIITKSGIPLAIFKAKYFRSQEFDRRVKEEGFISFTAHFKLNERKLVPQLEHLPRIMFIDTSEDDQPDRVSLEQLYLLGWDFFFDIDELLQYLNQLFQRSAINPKERAT